jgi:hypothetical protein
VTKNNNSAAVRDELRRMLLQKATERDRERQELIELEASGREWLLSAEESGINCSLARNGWRQAMSDLATGELSDKRVLQYLDKIGRPSRMEMYRKYKQEALLAFHDDESAAKKRFRFLSGLEVNTARKVWWMLKREDEK